jgi:hypothetical protein
VAVYGDAADVAAEPAVQSTDEPAAASDELPALQAAPWMSPADREWQEMLAYFESLVAKAKQPARPHRFYDERAAADYAAAELAAAKAAEVEEAVIEGDASGKLTLPAGQKRGTERLRFSAMIRVLPDSNLADGWRPVLIGLQVRGQWALAKLGLADDLRTAVALFQPRENVENIDGLSWNDYNNFAENVVEVEKAPAIAKPAAAESPSIHHERYLAATADFLETFSRVSHHAAQELRRIAGTRVAKSNSGETSQGTQR